MKNKLHKYTIIHLALLLSIFILSCGSDKGTNGGDDTTPPTVTQTAPFNNQQDVPINSTIRATFSEAIDINTLAGNFTVSNATATNLFYVNNEVTFNPTVPLEYNTVYTATLTTNITDEAGNNLASTYTWTFRTVVDSSVADLIDPQATISNPPNNDIVRDTVTIQVVASDNIGVDYVEFYLDNVKIVGSDDSTAPYEYLLDLSTETPGSPNNIYAIAYDTAGNSGQSSTVLVSYLWSGIPQIINFFNNSIVGDTFTIKINAPTGMVVDRIDFYVDDTLTSFPDAITPYEYYLESSTLEIGSNHTFHAVAFDTTGDSSVSPIVTYSYLWKLLVDDQIDTPWPQAIDNVWIRRQGNSLDFRVETANDWTFYNLDTIAGIDVAFFLDTDRDNTTGRTMAGSEPIGDIGADFRAIIGWFQHGDSLHEWSELAGQWVGKHDINGFTYGIVQDDTNFFEIGIDLSQIGNPTGFIDIVVANVRLKPDPLTWDWAPSSGHVSFNLDTPILYSPRREPFIEKNSTQRVNQSVADPFD